MPGDSSSQASQETPRWTETERQAFLRVIPGRIYRIRLHDDGSVTIVGGHVRLNVPPREPVSSDAPGILKPAEGPGEQLCRELARQASAMRERLGWSGEVRVFPLRFEVKGRVMYYEVRAATCAQSEIVALVRDVPAGHKSELEAVRGQSGIGGIVRSQISSYVEDEEVVRDVSARLNTLLEDTIGAIQTAVQKKDPATSRHQARVWKLACAIAREMGLGKTRVAIIGLAALVHDFGKVFIPSDILNKPGKLSESEYSAVKNHAEAVFQVLSTIDLFCPIADIVHQHHERMDGSGYPLGLKGEEILLESRIIAVADVVEAMLSARPHRPALGVEAATKEIEMGKGRLYDINAVDACVRLFSQGRFQFDPEGPAAQ